MSKAEFWQRGESIDYTNSGNTKIEENEVVVLGSRVGIAGTVIPAGETGSLVMTGVFEMDKKDSTAISAGTTVYWNPDSAAPGITASADDGETDPTAYPYVGYATEAAAADDTTIKVKLLG